MSGRRNVYAGYASVLILIAGVAYFNRTTPSSGPLPDESGKTKTEPVTEIAVPVQRPQPKIFETHTPIDDALARSFELELTTVSRSLPSTEKLNRLSDSEVHHTPRAITDAARKVGALAQRVNSDARLVPQAVRFYVDCAARNEVEITVRSICYSKLRRLEQRYQLPPTPGSESIPANVLRAADDGLER